MIINKNQTVYIYAPHSHATGGPELLHQLGAMLCKYGKKVKMVYYPQKSDNPVHQNYKEYMLEWVYKVPDKKDTFVVLPESMAELKKNYINATIGIWWLSVDFYFLGSSNFYRKMINRLGKKFFDKHLNIGFDNGLIADINVYHFYQSEYARQFLATKGIANNRCYSLSDYLHESFLAESTDINNKEDFVAYNPQKGFKFTKMLIENFPHIKFVPIENMTRNEVISLLKKAKVYIDFGFHPGKDRIPREAAWLKCCVITGKKGAALNEVDVFIPESFKFDEKEFPSVIKNIGNKIEQCINDYTNQHVLLEPYLNLIQNEKNTFIREVKFLIS